MDAKGSPSATRLGGVITPPVPVVSLASLVAQLVLLHKGQPPADVAGGQGTPCPYNEGDFLPLVAGGQGTPCPYNVGTARFCNTFSC